MKTIRITIGIPNSNEYLHRRFVQSLMSLKYPTNVEIDFMMVFGTQIPFARNRIVQDALKKQSDYVFFIDADMVFPEDSLIRLLNRNLPIINALAFRRISPHYPCIFSWNSEKNYYETVDYSKQNGNIITVDATGMACMLIKTDVFKKMKQPWYYYRDNIFSSDLTFCENARKVGYNISIDTSLKIGHIGSEEIITEEYYLNHLSNESKEEWNSSMQEVLKSRMSEKENCPHE